MKDPRAVAFGDHSYCFTDFLHIFIPAAELGHYAVGLLEQGIGNRVVGIQKDEIVDFDIQEALSMKKAYETELHKIAEQIAI